MKIAEAAELTSICAHGKGIGTLFRGMMKYFSK